MRINRPPRIPPAEALFWVQLERGLRIYGIATLGAFLVVQCWQPKWLLHVTARNYGIFLLGMVGIYILWIVASYKVRKACGARKKKFTTREPWAAWMTAWIVVAISIGVLGYIH